MMVDKKFTNELKQTFDYIQNTLLKEYDCDKIATEYFILAVLQNDFCVGHRVLAKIMLHDTMEKAKVYFYQWLSMNAKTFGSVKQYDEIFERSINNARLLAVKQKSKTINSGHVLLSILVNNVEINKYFKTLGVTVNQISSQVAEETRTMDEEEKCKTQSKFVNSTPQKHIKKPKKEKEEIIDTILNVDEKTKANARVDGECGRVTINLNEKAYNLQIETICGNEGIYKQMFNVLSKRNKNNVVLVGKSGVGKTDTVRNLANLIVSGNVPRSFRNKVLLEVDFNSLFYGTQMRGAFETKMKSIISEIKQNGNYIFFVDSLESVMNNQHTQTEVEEFIETLMKEKNAMLICTCSEKSFSKEVGDIPSWDRYFEKITLEEPTDEECIKILKHHANKLETFHDVHYDENTYETCVKLSRRYITERCLPDSAIDIFDKAGAKQSLIDYENEEIANCRNKLKDVRNEIATLKHKGSFRNNNVYDTLIKREIELNTSLDFAIKQHNLTKKKPLITSNNIKECISEKTNVPITDLTIDDKAKLKNLNERIKKIVIGQDEAVDTVCKAIKRQRIGISNPNKPVVLFFGGTTGVGKTFLCKTLAKELWGDEKQIIRLDMSEYSEQTSVTKLYGAPPSYVGYGDSGSLVDKLKMKKNCILLLDEIEKANEKVYNVFLQLFDEGRLTDSKGNMVDCKNIVVIMTSNIGAKEVDERGNGIGFVTNTEEIKKEIIEKEIKRKFKPEFINRIDKIIYFNKLTNDNIKFIINLEIDKIRKRLQSMGYDLQDNLENTDWFNNIYNNVIEKKNMGARPIIRELQTKLEDKITDYIIDNEIENGHLFSVNELV